MSSSLRTLYLFLYLLFHDGYHPQVRFSTRCPLPSSHHTRHEFYETDERLTLTVFDRGADPAHVNVKFQSRRVCTKRVHSYINNPNNHSNRFSTKMAKNILEFQPLKGQIDPEKSSYVVGKVKVEIRLAKLAQGRWGGLIGDAPDRTSICTQVHTIWLMSRSSSRQFFCFCLHYGHKGWYDPSTGPYKLGQRDQDHSRV